MKNQELLEKIEHFEKISQNNAIPGLQGPLNKALQESLQQYNFIKNFQDNLNKALQMTDVSQKVHALEELNVRARYLPDDYVSVVSTAITNLISQLRY